MALHFAPAVLPGRSPASSPIAKALAVRAREQVANDNAGGPESSHEAPPANAEMLRAALRHFAKHGIGAARDARAQAEQAFFDGDRQAYDWWLNVTRTLDRRLAQEAERLSPDLARP